MDEIGVHYILLYKNPESPSEDHVVFRSSGFQEIEGIRMEVPLEAYYMPLALWMGMGRPEVVTIAVVEGDEVPRG